MSNRPTYLLGMGATKAGTTWAYRYLAGHPDCHMRSVKELHFFDSLDKGFERQIKVNQAKLERFEAQLKEARTPRVERTVRDLQEWLSVLREPSVEAYRSYLEGWRGAKKLVGDITPAYADLSAESLQKLVSVNEDVRGLYLMRDPLARMWSHVRMVASRSKAGQADFAGECARVLDRVLAGEPSEIALRSDYQSAVTRLQGAFAPERLLIQFQERLLTPPGLKQLCEFLGIRGHAADTSVRVHEGPALPMTADQKARMRAYLRPQYDFVAKAFPALPDSWRANLDGVTA